MGLNFNHENGYLTLTCTEDTLPIIMRLALEWHDGETLSCKTIYVADGYRMLEGRDGIAEVFITNEFLRWWSGIDDDDRDFILTLK